MPTRAAARTGIRYGGDADDEEYDRDDDEDDDEDGKEYDDR